MLRNAQSPHALKIRAGSIHARIRMNHELQYARVCLCVCLCVFVCEHWQPFDPGAAEGIFCRIYITKAPKVSGESAAEGVSFINTVSVSS